MERVITKEDIEEIESLLAPLEGRMDKVIKDYILASRSHAAIAPRGDNSADVIFEDSYDMGCVINLLEFLNRLLIPRG